MISAERILSLTPVQAVRGTGLRSIIRDHGVANCRKLVYVALWHADQLCGGRCSEGQLVEMAVAIQGDFTNHSIETIVLAIRKGITTDKVFGQITYDQVARWINAFLEQVRTDNTEHYLAHRG